MLDNPRNCSIFELGLLERNHNPVGKLSETSRHVTADDTMYKLDIGDVVDNVRTVSMTVDDTTNIIGTIKCDGMFVWVPAEPMPYHMTIQQSISFRYEDVVDLVQHCVDRQFESYLKNKTPDTDTLHPDLRPHVVKMSFGLMIKHPLTFVTIHTPLMNAQTNAYYKHKRKQTDEYFRSKRWREYVWAHERPYRLDAFCAVSDFLAPTRFWSLFRSLWMDSENIYQNYRTWKSFWNNKRTHRHTVMVAAERRKLEAMPETITIYRGTAYHESINGLSWTTERNTAVWFSRRFSRPGDTVYIITAEVDKEHVFAYLTGRDENEIVIDPRNISVKSIEEKEL